MPLKLKRFVLLFFIFITFLLIFKNASAVELSFTFAPSPDIRIVGYKFYFGPTANLKNSVDLGLKTTYKQTGLLPGSTYYFAATAYDQFGAESGFSNIISFTIPIGFDSDKDGLSDILEDSCCTLTSDPDTDNDGILDGTEDKNSDCLVAFNETNPCDWDSDMDGLADGDEDVNRDGFRDPSELDPLDQDTDNDGFNDGLETSLGTNPLDSTLYPNLICVGYCDPTCNACAADLTEAMTLLQLNAAANFIRVQGATVFDAQTTLHSGVSLGIESGSIVLQN